MAQDLEQLVLTISADTRQMQRALRRLTGDTKSAADSVDRAFSGATPKIDNVAKSLGKTRFETANLAAQFQDIAVQLQGGQSPFTVALQQGTQISQVLGRQGATGIVSLLGSAFSSLLSPVSLATIGIIALGGIAVQYGAKAIGAVSDLDDKLKAHAELIKSLKDAYGEAGNGIDTAVHETVAVLKTLLGLNTDALRKQFDSLAKKISTSVSDFQITGLGPAVEQTSRKFLAFSDAIDTFKQSVKSGSPDVLAFRRGIQQVIDGSPDKKVRDLGKELLDMSEKAANAQLAIDATSKSLRQMTPAMQAVIDQGDAFAKAMKALGSTITPDLDDRQKVMKAYGDALVKAGSTEERLAAARARDDQLAILSANEKKKAGEEAAKSAESAQKRFQSALDSTSRRTAGIQGEIEALGQGAGAIAKLETQYRLTEQAQQSFGKVTPEVAASIEKVAAAAGNAADSLSKAKLASQIDFGSKTALLSDEDVKIAQQLASIYGNDVPAALRSTEASAIRTNDALRGISSQIQSSLVSGLADIVDGTKSASQGFTDLGKSILRMLEEAAIKAAIVQPLFGALGLGGSGGLLTSLIPKFASGTNFAPGGAAIVGERGPELVNLPRGAQVIPNHELGGVTGGGVTNVNYTIDARGADSGTVARIQKVLSDHARVIIQQGRAMQSAQRMQSTGVS